MKMNSTKKIAAYGIMIALALVFSYVESQIPAFFAFPGMKLGLTNIVVLTGLYKMGNVTAVVINILRIALVSIMFGEPSAFLYSLAGGMLSTIVMILLKNIGGFSGLFRLLPQATMGAAPGSRQGLCPMHPAAFEKAGETFAIMSFIASVNKYPTRARKYL